MSLKIVQIDGKGDAGTEKIWIQATAACSLGDFFLVDTTYSEGALSNIFRHSFFFPKVTTMADDWICLHTGKGTYKREQFKNKNGGVDTIHNFYWGSDAPVWNNTGDVAALFKTALADHKVAVNIAK